MSRFLVLQQTDPITKIVLVLLAAFDSISFKTNLKGSKLQYCQHGCLRMLLVLVQRLQQQ